MMHAALFFLSFRRFLSFPVFSSFLFFPCLIVLPSPVLSSLILSSLRLPSHVPSSVHLLFCCFSLL